MRGRAAAGCARAGPMADTAATTPETSWPIVTGGKLNSLGANAKLGGGDFLVAEADESDGSFLKLSPTIAVVTNIDREHMDHYQDMDDVKSAFLNFMNKVPFYGCAVICLDHPAIPKVLDSLIIEDRVYLVMEFVDGKPIDEYCDDHQLNTVERLKLFRRLDDWARLSF